MPLFRGRKAQPREEIRWKPREQNSVSGGRIQGPAVSLWQRVCLDQVEMEPTWAGSRPERLYEAVVRELALIGTVAWQLVGGLGTGIRGWEGQEVGMGAQADSQMPPTEEGCQ